MEQTEPLNILPSSRLGNWTFRREKQGVFEKRIDKKPFLENFRSLVRLLGLK
jgi:hypothetical protein